MARKPRGGGPTAQDGIYFQNSITALRLAHMLTREEFADAYGEPLGHIVRVRAEASTEVDDTVVEFSSGRTEYIQAKIDIAQSGDAWEKLWEHFYKQYHSSIFKKGSGGDVITLAARNSDNMTEMETLFARAAAADTPEEWEKSLTKKHKQIKEKIAKTLAGSGMALDDEGLHRLLNCISVWQAVFESDPRGTDTFEAVVNRTLRGTVAAGGEGAFSALLALVGNDARLNASWDYAKLKRQLEAKGVRLDGITRKAPRKGRAEKRAPSAGSIDVMNGVRATKSKFRDIVGIVVTGPGSGSGGDAGADEPPAKNIRVLNKAILKDVEARDVIGWRRGR
jgi:hypothetical protein